AFFWAVLLTTLVAVIWTTRHGDHSRREPPALERGVQEALAQSRAARVSDLRYDLSFSIPSARDQRIAGHARITFALGDRTTPLAFDFEPNANGRLTRIEAGGTTVEPTLTNGHLVLPVSVLKAGANEVTIDFDAGDAPLNRSDDFLYTIFV